MIQESLFYDYKKNEFYISILSKSQQIYLLQSITLTAHEISIIDFSQTKNPFSKPPINNYNPLINNNNLLIVFMFP